MDFMKSFVDTWEKPVMDFGSLPVRSGGAADFPPVLSVVIPVYNVATWLNDCLDSLRAQTFTAWECWLIDDGSLDFSGIICDHYEKKDARFHVIHQKNQGVSVARNVGIENATGKYLAFIDPDDFISENYFSAQLEKLDEHNADFSVTESDTVDNNGAQTRYFVMNQIDRKYTNHFSRLMKNNDEVQSALCENLFSCVAWKKVFRRGFWGNARFPAGIDLGEDMMTVPPLMVKANRAVYVPEATYFWRQRKGSLLNGTVSKERLYMDLRASKEMLNLLIEYNPDREKDFRRLKGSYDFGCYHAYLNSGGKKDYKIYLDILEEIDKKQVEGIRKDYAMIETLRNIKNGSGRDNGS